MDAIVDMQGFIGKNNTFVPKEVTVLLVEGAMVVKEHTYLIHPPYAFGDLSATQQRTVNWAKNNYHSFGWQDGNVPYVDFVSRLKMILTNVKQIYVKGKSKGCFLRQHIHACIPIFHIDNPGFKLKLDKHCTDDYKYACMLHQVSFRKACSRQNAYVILNALCDEHLTAQQRLERL